MERIDDTGDYEADKGSRQNGGDDCALTHSIDVSAHCEGASDGEQDQHHIKTHFHFAEFLIVASGSIFHHSLRTHYDHVGTQLDDNCDSLDKTAEQQHPDTPEITRRMKRSHHRHINVNENRKQQ